jgi:hypothetical protein
MANRIRKIAKHGRPPKPFKIETTVHFFTVTRKAEAKWDQEKPGHEEIFLSAEGDTSAYYGKLKEASKFSERAVTST